MGVKWKRQGPKRPRTGDESTNPAVAKALKTDTRFSSTQWKRLDTEDLQAGDFALADGEFFVLNTILESQSPVTDTWTADFLSREGESRECLGKYLQDKHVPWMAKRRLVQVCGGTFPTNKWCYKVGKGSSPNVTLSSDPRTCGPAHMALRRWATPSRPSTLDHKRNVRGRCVSNATNPSFTSHCTKNHPQAPETQGGGEQTHKTDEGRPLGR